MLWKFWDGLCNYFWCLVASYALYDNIIVDIEANPLKLLYLAGVLWAALSIGLYSSGIKSDKDKGK